MDARLPPVLATLCAELHDLAALDRPGGRRTGSHSVKRIKGRRYWYAQHWAGSHRIQAELGPETPPLLAQIAKARDDAAAWRAASIGRRQICRSIRAAMRMTTDPLAGRVIACLADAGAFQAGLVLVGTHAFMTYPAMLGRRFAAASLRTGDIDLAIVALAAAPADFDLTGIVRRADADFLEVPPRPGARMSTALKHRTKPARVELLTVLRSGEAWSPVRIGGMTLAAQQAPFLDYLIEAPVAATYLHAEGIRVQVPHPARFALHKLTVAADRDVSAHAKSVKDLAQSAALVEALGAERPDDLAAAAGALLSRDQSYLRMLRKGAALLAPDTRAFLPRSLLA